MTHVLDSLQESILSHVQRIIKGEVSLAMKEQQAVVTSSIMQAMRSAAGTPVPTAHFDYQTQQANILQLLQQGQLNQAFQQVKLTRLSGATQTVARSGGAKRPSVSAIVTLAALLKARIYASKLKGKTLSSCLGNFVL